MNGIDRIVKMNENIFDDFELVGISSGIFESVL